MYDAVILAVPDVEAVKVELHVAVPVGVPAARSQFGNVPVTPDKAKATEPVGVVGDAEVSITVTVHVEDWVTEIVEGAHTTVVVVGLAPIMRVA